MWRDLISFAMAFHYGEVVFGFDQSNFNLLRVYNADGCFKDDHFNTHAIVIV